MVKLNYKSERTATRFCPVAFVIPSEAKDLILINNSALYNRCFMKDHESEEMYLETILVLKGERPAVRSIDIAEKLGYAKSSVSRGVSLLQDRGYIKVGDDGFIDFTEKGEKKANGIYERHNILTEFFVELGASEELAETNACRIEHVIDDQIFELIKQHVNNNH